MNGVIVKNRYYRDEGSDYVVERLAEEFALIGIDVKIADCTDFFDGGDLPDFAVFWDKDTVFARRLEKNGVKVFDSADSIRICDDKYLTYVELSCVAAYPETIISPLKYPVSDCCDREFLDEVAGRLSFPLIAKYAVGSLGNKVFLITGREELAAFHIANADSGRLMYQRYVSGSKGRDIRIYCVGGRAVASVRRKNSDSFKSNAEAGARTEKTEPKQAFIDAAEKIVAALKLDYASVDFFDTDTPLLNEVNSNAYFKEAEKASGVNIARAYAEHVFEVVKCLKKK